MLATNEVLNRKSCGCCRGGIPQSSQLSEVPQDACPLCKRVLRFGIDSGDSGGWFPLKSKKIGSFYNRYQQVVALHK